MDERTKVSGGRVGLSTGGGDFGQARVHDTLGEIKITAKARSREDRREEEKNFTTESRRRGEEKRRWKMEAADAGV
jgi:hypothetical protein